MDATPKVGMRFYHSKWMYENHDPQACEITRIAQGTLYYRDINRFMHDGKWLASSLGGRWRMAVEDFPKYCKAFVPDGELL